MGARRRIVLLLPILAVAVGAFGIGALVSGKLLWRDRGGVAIAESIPPPPQPGAGGCVEIAGPDGEAIKGRDGKPLCVPWDSWLDEEKFKKLTAEEAAALPSEKRAKVRKFGDGSLWLIEDPEPIDYRYFLKKYNLPDPYAEKGIEPARETYSGEGTVPDYGEKHPEEKSPER